MANKYMKKCSLPFTATKTKISVRYLLLPTKMAKLKKINK